jgi:outer membrane lipoprotein-sorting protein
MRHLFAVAVAVLTVASAAQTPTTTEQVIAAMHERYARNWYRTLTFEQQSITHKPDGTSSTETWQEAMLLPGRLRIDMGEPSAGNGALFVNGREYLYKAGKLVKERDELNPLLVLGFDVYRQPVDVTMGQLKTLHVDASTMHEEQWNGRGYFVVGAKVGDTHTAQFWIDKERLYFVRMLQPDEKDPKITEEFLFEDYKQVEGGGWLSEHVVMNIDGKLVFEEKYSKVQVNPKLSEGLFDPQRFVQP